GLMLLPLLIVLGGCDFVVQPLGGSEGRTMVYVAIGKLGAPNAGIICTRIGCVVIDPMLSPVLGDALNAQAQAKSRIFWDNLHSAGKTLKRTQAPPVLYVFNTTYRASHSFGNQSFNKADVISTTKAKERLEMDAMAMRAELRDQWKVPGLEYHAIASASLTVDEGAFNLDTPDIKIRFVAMGNCVGEGDAVVFLPAQKTIFAGDIVIPGYMPYHKGRTATVRNWIDTLKKLDKWDIDTVVPGHGEVARKNAITQQREFLEALVCEVEQAIKAGQTVEQAAQSVKLPKYAKWVRYDEWLPENVKLVYWELKATPAQLEQLKQKSGDVGIGAVKPTGIEQHDGFRNK
ncbi:MAG: MBL fold metallo-hydrolase, partial [Planctomycetota bacterium]